MIARLSLCVLMACLAAPGMAQSADEGAAPLAELTALSVGSFTSAAQAEADDRYDVVEAEIVRIWPERDDGIWLYQEQAILGAAGAVDPANKDRPYFQRVVQMTAMENGQVRRSIYTLPDPAAHVGAWREAAPLADLSPADLGGKTCDVFVERIARGLWYGESEPNCPNSYKGAVRMTNQTVITAEGYGNWDRGWSADDDLVWGPAEGGYAFDRIAAD